MMREIDLFEKINETASNALIKVLDGRLTGKDCNYIITLINRDLENTNNIDDVKKEERKQRIKRKVMRIRNTANKVKEFRLKNNFVNEEEVE